MRARRPGFFLALPALLVLGLALQDARAGAPAIAKTSSASSPKRAVTVAVLYFDYAGQDTELAVLRKGLTQMLISDLSSVDGLQVVERSRLEEVLAELKLGRGSKVKHGTAARIGRLLGARYLVLGSYFDLRKTLRADARVVEVETGKVVRSVGATGRPDDFLSLEQQLSGALEAILVAEWKRSHEPARGSKRPARRRRPKRPKTLEIRTALTFARALDAADRGDRKAAEAGLRKVVAKEPSFELASAELEKLLQ